MEKDQWYSSEECYVHRSGTKIYLENCHFHCVTTVIEDLGFSACRSRCFIIVDIIFLSTFYSIGVTCFRSGSFKIIPNYPNGVWLIHLQFGYPNQLDNKLLKFQYSLLIHAMKRASDKAATQPKLPITPSVLKEICEQLTPTDLFDVTFWAVCLAVVVPNIYIHNS